MVNSSFQKEKIMNDTEKKFPCEFEFKVRGKLEMVRPIDNCSCRCETCGFNPEEQKRRLKQGQLRSGPVVTILSFSSPEDKEGKPFYYVGLRSLHFPPRFRKEKDA